MTILTATNYAALFLAALLFAYKDELAEILARLM